MLDLGALPQSVEEGVSCPTTRATSRRITPSAVHTGTRPHAIANPSKNGAVLMCSGDRCVQGDSQECHTRTPVNEVVAVNLAHRRFVQYPHPLSEMLQQHLRNVFVSVRALHLSSVIINSAHEPAGSAEGQPHCADGAPCSCPSYHSLWSFHAATFVPNRQL